MGAFNSSVTRVWPVFDCLFQKDPAGIEWFPRLLRMGSEWAHAKGRITDHPGPLLPNLAKLNRDLPGILKKVLGPTRTAKVGQIRNAFESDIPPSEDFLRWLLAHPDQMEWPMEDRRNRIKRTYSGSTQNKRERLLSGDRNCRDEALRELTACGVNGSQRKWWAFEGFTSVDCRLETEMLLVLIEGKRTEPVSSATDWFPRRNQVVRNLEVARALADGKKSYAVLICAEKDVSLKERSWADSLPHMSESERAELRSHFLGFVTWANIAKQLCGDMRLPDELDDAVDLCLSYR